MNCKFLLYISILIAVFSASCEGVVSDNRKETGTKGEISIAIDGTLRKVMDQQLKVWDSSYPDGKITAIYTDEQDAFRKLLQDSTIRLIITTRDLTDAEKKAGENRKLLFKSLAVAQDAVVIIVNNESPDQKMTVGMLKNILNGGFPRKYNIVFDDPGSSIIRYVQDSVMGGQSFKDSSVYAAGSTDKVIEYVSRNKNALGIVGTDKIFTNNDSTGIPKFIKSVAIVALQAEDDTTNQYYQPYAANLALKFYPLRRNIYFVSKEAWSGLGTGFANFLSQPAGQTIFQKANMVPLRTPLEIKEVLIN